MSSTDKVIIVCARCRCKRFEEDFSITRLGFRLKTCSSCREKAKKILSEKKAKASVILKIPDVHICLVCEHKKELEK